ncbi:type II secretion system protein [Halalkalibacillus halophilus]|uniref:type II secretion system protein n=1 Tax=Halalkalibacillus halophilus TaxID=392827 RepID=UPI0003FE0521|nr:prepilin-type N-terminal cleavage/methylation domain-containing protein [Halalkalibacillus halophilus]
MLKRVLKNQKGVTLVELLAVIVILGIIALIAVPLISGVIEDSREDSVRSSAINLINSTELYDVTNNNSEGGSYSSGDDEYLSYINDRESADFSGATVIVEPNGASTISGTVQVNDTSLEFPDGTTVSDINDGAGN